MSNSIHVCLQIGDSSSNQKIDLGLVISGSNVRGIARMQHGSSSLDFAMEGRASQLVWGSEDIVQLALHGSSFIQTGGTLLIEAAVSVNYEKGLANVEFRPETGPVVVAKKQPVKRVDCPSN